MDPECEATCCPKKPDLKNRPLLTGVQALPLEQVFKLLANGTRLRIVHALARTGELCVSEIAEALGMKPTAVSNQLQRLADRGIVEPRRNGNQILYRVIDPCVVKLLDSAWCLTEDARMRASGRAPRERTAT
ncbi:MAG: metalloregulator ArsR/SmtB family transcription factor [Anaerolineaceae bacterium]|nr:metalloregulator ArsR/SmtB family transcription factor [Anaerolineaceae bacterium]